MATLSALTHINFVVLDLTRKPDAAVSVSDVVKAGESGLLLDLIIRSGDAEGIDVSALDHLYEGPRRDDIDDFFGRYANNFDSRKYGLSDHEGWLAVAYMINDAVFAAAGSMDLP